MQTAALVNQVATCTWLADGSGGEATAFCVRTATVSNLILKVPKCPLGKTMQSSNMHGETPKTEQVKARRRRKLHLRNILFHPEVNTQQITCGADVLFFILSADLTHK